jgi:hypothetical protein
MLNRQIGSLLVAVVLLAATSAPAGVLSTQQLKLDFTGPGITRQVSWTKAAKLKLDKSGLWYDAPGPESVEVSLQTIEPVATGLSWRPARNVSIDARVTPKLSAIKLDNGQTHEPSHGQMFVRFSPDAKHWSTWQVLRAQTDPTGYRFTGELAIARQDAAEYDELLAQYMKRDVVWGSDEEAAVQWILAAQPEFFARHQPFIGYLQLLYEANLPGGARIEHLDIDLTYSIGGAAMRPKDPKALQDRNGLPWRFRAR